MTPASKLFRTVCCKHSKILFFFFLQRIIVSFENSITEGVKEQSDHSHNQLEDKTVKLLSSFHGGQNLNCISTQGIWVSEVKPGEGRQSTV